LVLDGHDLHVMLEAIKLTQEFGLDMVILFFHIFHGLQLLDMSCFKHFKFVFKKDKNDAMVKNIIVNYTIAHLLVGWTRF